MRQSVVHQRERCGLTKKEASERKKPEGRHHEATPTVKSGQRAAETEKAGGGGRKRKGTRGREEISTRPKYLGACRILRRPD